MIRQWRIDRKIPVALLLAILMQLGAVLMWATQLEARVAQVEMHSKGLDGVYERLTRLEERVDAVKNNIAVLNVQAEKILDRVSR